MYVAPYENAMSTHSFLRANSEHLHEQSNFVVLEMCRIGID